MGTRIGILHPGQMGASVAAAAAEGGAEVGWASEGRSNPSRARAQAAHLHDKRTLSELVAWSEIVLSVCPPAAAVSLAESVAALDFRGVYVDANAVSPATARRVEDIVRSSGASFVDGSIIGLPPATTGAARIYLSGPRAESVRAVFAGGLFTPRVVSGEPGAASALKVCYAAWTKGSEALLLAIRALAHVEGVGPELLAEWDESLPGLNARSTAAAEAYALKAWRFEGEMREISAAFAERSLPRGFHLSAAEIYGRMARFKDRDPAPPVEEVLAALLEQAYDEEFGRGDPSD